MSPQLVKAFIVRQRDQIREGGSLALKRKLGMLALLVCRFPLFLVELPCALLIVLLVRCIRPFCIVRFGGLNSGRIGHFAANTELYLCERDAGINVPKIAYFDFWYYLEAPCNEQLDRMWRRVLRISPQSLLKLTARINSLIPGECAHVIKNTYADRDVHNLLDRFPPHLTFLPDEEKHGEAGLRAMGIPAGAPFVCLTVRDSAYLRASVPWKSWDYHNYRDCNVQNYVLAAQELAKRGYYVIRMGAVVREAINVAAYPRIIDYATNGMRNDFMDVYLGAKCQFCISNGTGFDAVPNIFRRPIVFIDHVSLGSVHISSSRFLITTKRHWMKNERRFMTFREIFESGAGYFFNSDQYVNTGIDLIESTPEEIAAVVFEMESRLKGTWQAADEDEVLQRRFWKIFPKGELHGEIRSRIGAEFLRQNKEWLE